MTPASLNDTRILANGVAMPVMGLGVWKAESGAETYNAVRCALDTGYRAIDTAAIYGNEADVGRAVRESGIPREEIFITTKVWYTDQGYEGTLRAFEESMRKMKLEYLDLFLIHHYMAPNLRGTWQAMEKLYEENRVRAIGVSNFLGHHLDELLSFARVKPMVNQIEMHPYLPQRETLRCNQAHGIQTESWAPLAKGRVLGEPVVTALAEKYGKTPAQVVLRWGLQLGVQLIPKSTKKARIEENCDIFDFSLTAEEMAAIDGLDRNMRFGSHPDDWAQWMK